MAVEDVIPQHQGARAAANKVRTDDESLRQPIRAWLHRIADVHAPLAAIAQKLLEARRILRRADDKDLAHTAQHQRAERVVDHRLVVNRDQLLAQRQCGRMQSGAGAASEDDAFALHSAHNDTFRL